MVRTLTIVLVSLAIGAATGRVATAVYGTIGVALGSHLLNSFLPLSDRFAGWARLTPNYYYLTSDPLVNGMTWAHAAVLAAITVMLLAWAPFATAWRKSVASNATSYWRTR